MKYIFLILISLISLSSKAQEIPKKANAIVVKGVTFNEAAMQLMDKGYIIDKSDSALHYITTKQKEGKNNIYVTLHIRIKDSSAIITGSCTNNISLTTSGVTIPAYNYEIAYRSLESSIYKVAFKRMNDFALSFNKPVEYLIQ